MCTRTLPVAAQQEAERARFIVEKAKQDRLGIVIKAEGEARSAELIGRAIADNPGFVQASPTHSCMVIACFAVFNAFRCVRVPRHGYTCCCPPLLEFVCSLRVSGCAIHLFVVVAPQLRRIDAAKDIAATVSKSANTVYLSADSLLLNLLNDSKAVDTSAGKTPEKK